MRPVDGESCVVALLRAGFRVQRRAYGLTLLRRDARVVAVPSVEVLSAAMLDAILLSAGMSEADFQRSLPRLPYDAPRPRAPYALPSIEEAPPSSFGDHGHH